MEIRSAPNLMGLTYIKMDEIKQSNPSILVFFFLDTMQIPNKKLLTQLILTDRGMIMRLSATSKENLLIALSNLSWQLKSIALQARNQEFFRAGEVSENKGTSINV